VISFAIQRNLGVKEFVDINDGLKRDLSPEGIVRDI